MFYWDAFQCNFKDGVSSYRCCYINELLRVKMADGFQSDRGEVTAVTDKVTLISGNQKSLAADIPYDN